jgi:hypothetical protein
VSQLRRHLFATVLAAVLAAFAVPVTSLPAEATGEGGAPPDTWVPAASLPARGAGTVLALAVDPSDAGRVLAGTTGGAIDLSTDGGASWRRVRSGLAGGVLALAFDPFASGVVLAGTGNGIWASKDGGVSWSRVTMGGSGPVRAFAFAPDLALAGTDHGVWASRGNGPWFPSGLEGVAVSALAAWGGTGPQPQVLAGGDGGGETALPLYRSADGARTWTPFTGTVGASGVVAALAAGSPVPGQDLPRLLLGTNAGLFASGDGGASWQQLTGGGELPPTDFSAVAFSPRDSQRLYVASDGGGSSEGGLWVSGDGGAHFTSLEPPAASVTALALAAAPTPVLYAATLRPSDQSVQLWSYRDAGGAPGRAQRPPARAGGRHTRPPAPAPATIWARLSAWLGRPETPYLGLGALAALVVLLALVTYARRERQL